MNREQLRATVRIAVASVLVLLLVAAVFMGVWFGVKGVSRYQKTHDAQNNAKIARIQASNEALVNELRIKAQAQKVKITQQEAEIKYTEATGLRRAQDEIAKTLTPMYIQHEAIDAMREGARYGNHTVYIPSGENGVPIVQSAPQGR